MPVENDKLKMCVSALRNFLGDLFYNFSVNVIKSRTCIQLHIPKFSFKFIFCNDIKKKTGLITAIEILLKGIIIVTFFYLFIFYLMHILWKISPDCVNHTLPCDNAMMVDALVNWLLKIYHGCYHWQGFRLCCRSTP